MRFDLKAALNTLFRNLGRHDLREEGEDGSVSMVMLLRESRVFTLEKLRTAGDAAFGTPFTDDEESKYFVVQKAIFTIMKVGPHAISFLHYAKPYLDDRSAEFGAAMPKTSQQKAWALHTAWEAIDYVKSKGDLDLEYAIVAKLCLQLVDENCTGVYLPKHGIFVPNDGSLLPYLQSVASGWKPS